MWEYSWLTISIPIPHPQVNKIPSSEGCPTGGVGQIFATHSLIIERVYAKPMILLEMSELEDSIENCDRSQPLELEDSIESNPNLLRYPKKHSDLISASVDLTHPALRAPLRGGDLHAEVNS
jgi:hypothetical protein